MLRLRSCTLRVACLLLLVGSRAHSQSQPKAAGSADDAGLLPAGAVVRIQASRPGHAAVVSSIAFAPDGTTLASASYDEALSIWEVGTGKELFRITAHPKLCSTVFCPDGRTLVSAGWDGTIRLWQVATGEQIRQVRGHEDRVLSLALSADGKTLASAGPQAALSLWESATGREVRRLAGRASSNCALAFCPDGTLLASSSHHDQAVQLWEVGTGRPIRQLGNPETSVYSFAFTPDGKSLISGGGKGQLILWEVATAGERLRFGGHPSTVQCLAISPDGKTIVSGHDDGLLCAWDAATGMERCRLPGHRERVRSVAFAPTGALWASGSEDMTILVWSVDALGREERAQAAAGLPKDMAALWADLASNDAGRAYRAILALVAVPEHSVPFLRQATRSLWGTQKRMARLVVDLDDQRYAVRRKASLELEQFGQQAEAVLRGELARQPSMEVRRRVQQLLDQLPSADQFVLSGQQARTLRTLEVLERIGTPSAKHVLESLVEGVPEMPLRREAQASLQRLAKRATVTR